MLEEVKRAVCGRLEMNVCRRSVFISAALLPRDNSTIKSSGWSVSSPLASNCRSMASIFFPRPITDTTRVTYFTGCHTVAVCCF